MIKRNIYVYMQILFWCHTHTHTHLFLVNFQPNWNMPINLKTIYLAIIKLLNKNSDLLGCDAVSHGEQF